MKLFENKTPELRYEDFITRIFKCKRNELKEASPGFFNRGIRNDQVELKEFLRRAFKKMRLDNSGYVDSDKLLELEESIYQLENREEFVALIDSGFKILKEINS